ncbi:NAD(P)H-binding protein [Mucilaginibacter sp. UR6-1]|uniref:NAD(P)H-binding protein n=1 Tax=Mucilaginibacter sp. UR6-1 TaxID=1435643 RepID=UPI001E295808|nr:NAD(P)H-binding protein [Mucilaginibacter sp. UR6-1]MCC8410917.1 NAD(P)H-binding protein [Mucilaginibacter sp. UR6-1]
MAYKAIIAGASGLIGSNLLTMLLQHPDYDEVLLLNRRQLPVQHKKLIQAIINFDELDKYSDLIKGHAVFCCLGTTQKQTPDRKTYRQIDHDYPVKLAQFAAQNGVKQYHLVSAIGANTLAANFYLKTKGDAEKDIRAADVESLHIYQPSFLEGKRSKPRLGEKIATAVFTVLNPLLLGGFKKYRSIKAESVAAAMLNQSLTNNKGVFVYTTDKIKQLA